MTKLLPSFFGFLFTTSTEPKIFEVHNARNWHKNMYTYIKWSFNNLFSDTNIVLTYLKWNKGSSNFLRKIVPSIAMFPQYQLWLKVLSYMLQNNSRYLGKYLDACIKYLPTLCTHFFPNGTIVLLPKRYSTNVNFAICKVLHNFKDKRNVLPDSNAILGKHQPFIWAAATQQLQQFQ